MKKIGGRYIPKCNIIISGGVGKGCDILDYYN